MKKILIIAGALHLGGAERVAANLCCYAPDGEFEFHYAVFEGYENVYGPEIEALGGKVFTLPSPSSGYLRYCRALSALIRENCYCAVHSHTQFNSGLNLWIAKRLRVPIRIAHSHTTKTERAVPLTQRGYERFMRLLLRRCATHFVGCGREAGAWMFGAAFEKKGVMLRNGIDTQAYAYSESNRAACRRHWGFGAEDYVIGHAGTLLPLKNQEFLIRLLPELQRRVPAAKLLLLGSGTLEEQKRLRDIADQCGVGETVVFAGGVRNVHEAMSAMDVFAFPSLREGTPLALLEAQANGLPCVVSDRIPADAFLTDLVRPLSLENREAWLSTLCEARRSDPLRYPQQLAEQGYDIHNAYQPVYAMYRSIASVSLSFDDGRGDNTQVLDSLLLPKGIPATLNITTGYVDGSCPPALCPSDKPAMAKDDVQRFHKNPLVEIAMHGDCHQNTEADILRGREKLLAWLKLEPDAALGFASPGSGLSLDRFRSQAGLPLRQAMKYHRTSLRINSLAPIRVLCRKAGRVLHLPILFGIAYHDTVMTAPDGQILYSIPVMKDATVKQLEAVLRSCVRRRGALVLMLHSIEAEDREEDNWTWRQDKLERLCDTLLTFSRRGQLEVCTTAEQFDRLVERT